MYYRVRMIFKYMDDRAKFANDVCRLIYQNNNEDLSSSLIVIEPFYNHFNEHVRNIYQFIAKQIPLFWLYELNKSTPGNWGYNQEEYDDEVERTITLCHELYQPR